MWIFAAAGILGALFALIILPETRGRSLDQIESGFSSKSEFTSPVQPVASVFAQPKTITLQKFAPIAEEKYHYTMTNAYAYDNFSLDLSADDADQSKKDSAKESAVNRNVSHAISLEHVYF